MKLRLYITIWSLASNKFMITIKLNVLAIEKSRLFKGAKGTYLDAVLIETPESQYGDYMIVQSVTKEEREQGIKGPILGNAKIIGQKPVQQAKPAQTPVSSGGTQQMELDDESVPFWDISFFEFPVP